MKTILRGLALAALGASLAAVWTRPPSAPRHLLQSPGLVQERFLGHGVVRGQVLHQGTAVGGASVAFLSDKTARTDRTITSPTVWRAATGIDGRFELTGLPAGRGRIAAFAAALAPTLQAIEIPSDTTELETAINLESGVAVTSRIMAGSAPVAAARVSIWLAADQVWITGGNPFRETTSDSDGRLIVEGLAPDRPLRLLVRADGYRPFEKSLASPAGMPDPIDLDPGLAAWGRIVTSAGAPVPGAEVTVGSGGAYVVETRSDASGIVQIGGLEARHIAVHIHKDGYAPARLDLPGVASGWTVVLHRTGGIAGRVALESGAACLVVKSAGATYRRPLAADGSFRWEGLPPGTMELQATDGSGRMVARGKAEIPEGEIADGILLAP